MDLRHPRSDEQPPAYPHPELQGQLQFLCSPAVYRERAERYRWGRGPYGRTTRPDAPYWELIPHYTYATCPLCGAHYREPVDTYSLGGWVDVSRLKKALYLPPGMEEPACSHLRGLHVFINLHDQIDTGRSYWQNVNGDVPLISPWLLSRRVESYAVLHGLPICRIVGEQFVPTYTVFCLAYFSADPIASQAELLAAERARPSSDPEYYPAEVASPLLSQPSYYDLDAYAKRGRLGWLDLDDPGLPLRLGVGGQLPAHYHIIAGHRRSYTLREGRRLWR